jgi:predicted MFS family arabinose efflux permease
MVWTHLPSNVLLILVPLMPTLPLAIATLLMRFSISQMDVPTRQSYVMAVVPPGDRTFASGLTNLTRTGGWAVGAAFGGTAMQITLAAPLVIGGTLKIVYDIVLYRSFRHVRPPEEQGRQAASGTMA